MMNIGSMPVETLLRKQKALARELRAQSNLLEVRIAVLGGSTTNEFVDFLELLLLDLGIRPVLYQSEYNKYFEEAVLSPSPLTDFRPDIVYIHTSSVNIQCFPQLDAKPLDMEACVSAEAQRFAAIWQALQEKIGCMVIQNNFETPSQRLLGNLDCVSPGGHVRFINLLNSEFAQAAPSQTRLFMNDLNSIAAAIGLNQFHDPKRWFRYKLITSPRGSLAIAKSAAAIIGGIYGRSRKCLVLDLDNTLWGGVIGDDGPARIKIGKETPEAEAYTAFQQYCLRLRDRGILLAVCSKNTAEIAQQGLEHPDSVLRLNHFSCFKVNWEPKHENLKAIAAELNLGLDSLVFVDDNPAEREIVSAQLPMVAVPDFGSDISNVIAVLEEARYFEPVTLSREDLERARQYENNAERSHHQGRFASYGEYLDSLEMSAEIEAFKPVYLERIAQLINKTNQFNLTTRRYTLSEVEKIALNPGYITLYGKLSDRFGDNGLISVIIGRQEQSTLHVDLWIMSCRVIKRDMELAMLDSLAAICIQREIREIHGYYVPTERNGLVADHYAKLGFEQPGEQDDQQTWKLNLTPNYIPRNKHIKELVRG
jgi:FkbH-like protein